MEKKELYKATTADRNLESFEFYMSFDDTNIEEEIDRNGLAHFWTHGITEEALGDGYDIIEYKDDGQEFDTIPDNQAFQKYIDSTGFPTEFIEAVGKARAYGKCGILHFEDGSIKSFRPKDMDLEWDQNSRKIVGGTLYEYVDYDTNILYKHKLTSSNIDFFYLMFFKEKSYTNRGRSELEPIWDYLQGLFICNFLSPLVVAQTMGIKILKSPTFEMKGAQSLSEKQAALLPLRDSSWKLRLGIGTQDSFEVHYPTNNTFIQQTTDQLYTALAAATGYPKPLWMGQNDYKSGQDMSMFRIQTIHKKIQKNALYYLKKSIAIMKELDAFPVLIPEEFDIKYRFGEDLTQEGQAALLYKKAQSITTLKEVLTRDEIRELLGYNPDGGEFLSQDMDKKMTPNEFESRMPQDNSQPDSQIQMENE